MKENNILVIYAWISLTHHRLPLGF